MKLAILDHGKHILKYLKWIGLLSFLLSKCLKEAASRTGMTGCADLMYLCKDGIIITIQVQGFHILEMSGGLPFQPLSLAAAAVIVHLSGAQSIRKSLLIHVSKHQHLRGLVILDNDRNQACLIGLKICPGNAALQNIHRDAGCCKLLFFLHVDSVFRLFINQDNTCSRIRKKLFCQFFHIAGGAHDIIMHLLIHGMDHIGCC